MSSYFTPKQKTLKQLMSEAKERNDKLYDEYLNGNKDYHMLADKYGLTYDNVKKIIYRRNKKNDSIHENN